MVSIAAFLSKTSPILGGPACPMDELLVMEWPCHGPTIISRGRGKALGAELLGPVEGGHVVPCLAKRQMVLALPPSLPLNGSEMEPGCGVGAERSDA